MFSSQHERVKSSLRDRASILTTDVNEERSGAASFQVVLVIPPVPLSIRLGVLEVEVINLVHESCFFKVSYVDYREVLVLSLSVSN